MENDIRESGIDIIGNILWGTHIGQIYSTKEEYFAIAAPYIQRGLMNNELCVWIHGKDMGCEDVKDIIGGYCRDIDIYLESGQLRIIPYTEWYMTGNSFNEVRVNRQWNELVRHALDKGYDGLRAVADTSWLKKSYFRSFSHYEHSVNKTISELPFTVMCLYNTNKLDAPEVAEIIKNHSYVITSSENGYGLVRNVELLIKDKQLERSERRYKKLVQLIPDCIFIHNEKSIFFCNDSAMNITGIKDHNRLSGMSMLDLVPCEFKESFLMFIKKSLEGNIGCNYMRSRFICKNGENMDAWIITTKYDFQGYPALLSVVRDITPFRKIFE
ncbi:MAG: MEDS domain-containing protein, partial [Acetivibrionales bacterium]